MFEGYRVRAKIMAKRVQWLGFRLFLVSLGVLIGASGVYVYLEAPKLLETSVLTLEQPLRVETARAQEPEKKPETVDETIRRVAKEKGFENVSLLLKIASCESGDGKGSIDRYAENPNSSAKGAFQILDMHGLSVVERFDIEKATAWTIDKIEKQGLGAWVSSKSCWNK